MESGLKILSVKKIASRPSRPQTKLASDLGAAISQDDIAVHFQPQYELRSVDAVGVEALACEWNLVGQSAPLARAARTLAQCKRHGVRIALDDFGTAYSGFDYLAPPLPADAARDFMARPWGQRHAGGQHAV